jgi:mono/diheme cytochrome c family protein
MLPGALLRRWRLLPALFPLLAALPAAAVPPVPAVTFSRDVAPILQANCQECHRPGEIGPFSLLTYQDAQENGSLIKEYTQQRIMPPWKPVPGHGEFRNERRLTDEQIRTLAAWVDADMPEGDPKDLPPPRQFTQGWTLGEPDLALDAGEGYEVPAEGPDVYRNFVLPYQPDKDQWVTAVEVRPDRRSVVHHIIVYIDPLGQSRALDAADPGLGFTSTGGGPGFAPVDGLGGWAPGNTPPFSPPGTAWKVPARARLVMQVHYHPNGEAQTDRTRIGIHFAREPIRQQMRAFPLANLGLAIPPGEARHEERAALQLSTDVTLHAIAPHMHLLGREMKVTATLPDGSVKPLLWIQDWDFHWQETYLFKAPVRLPAGSRVDVTATYDNSEANPHNPNTPPQWVTWGEQTTDEMCICFLILTLDAERLAN